MVYQPRNMCVFLQTSLPKSLGAPHIPKIALRTSILINILVSGLTGKPLNGMQVFAPMMHVRAGCHVHVERDNFKIIGHEKDPYLVQLKESIIINTSRPKLNGNLTSVPLHLFASY